MARTSEKYTVEKEYRELYDDIRSHLHDWRLFTSVENNEYAYTEKICSSLGNLATIYRRRGWHLASDEVMPRYKEILDRHTQMIRQQAVITKEASDNSREMVNKYHLIAANLAIDLKRPSGVPQIHRTIMQFEIDTGKARDNTDTFIWMINTFCGKPKTHQGLAATTDDELLQCYYVLAQAPPDQPNRFQSKKQYRAAYPGEVWGVKVVLALCAACQSTEPFLDTYKVCSRCKSVKYCGKDCQVAHYKEHKAECKRITATK